MKLRLIYTLMLVGCITACDSMSKSDKNHIFTETDLALIPSPKEVTLTQGFIPLSTLSAVEIASADLLPLGELIAKHLHTITDKSLTVTQAEGDKNTIYIALDHNLKPHEYSITVTDRVKVIANDYPTAARAMSTLIQSIQEINDNRYAFPKLSLTDHTDYAYRSVMLDLARFWQPVETIKETIDLLWYYKINYLSLHLSDNRRFTFPLEKYPKLKKTDKNGQRAYYTLEELNDLVRYAKDRGVIIIPEVDLPGHSAALWNTYPEVFGNLNPKTQEADQLYVVNMAKEKTYEAINEIINALAEVFYTSPFIHIGGDEVYLEVIKKVPSYQEYTKKHGLTEASEGNAGELFCHFINRLNAMVKAAGKKTIVWEGFHHTGAGNVTIDKDIAVIVWNTTYNHPKNLIDNGYKIMNSTWIPWYMVGAMNFAPPAERAFQWDVNQWSHWKNSIKDITIEKGPAILGGQLSFWEQNYQDVIPVLRSRTPVLAQRLWSNASRTSYEQFTEAFAKANARYTRLFRPVSITPSGLLNELDQTFTSTISVSLNSSQEGSLHYVYSEDWGMPDMAQATAYTTPFDVDKSGILTVQLMDKNGHTIGYPEQRYFQKIEPYYHYTVYRPNSPEGWDAIPDFSTLTPIREGLSGKMTPERLAKVNGRLFAKVKGPGHIDTRFEGLYNPYAVQLTGTLHIPKDQTYTFTLLTDDGLGALYIDGKLVGQGTTFAKKPEDFKLTLTAGTHEFSLHYFYKKIQNQLNLTYKTDEMNEALPFEELVKPLKQ